MSYNLSIEQQTAIDTYNKTLELYLGRMDLTIAGQVYVDWIDAALKLVPKNAIFLEIGSGYGRDADRIESQGYKVIRTDVTDSFLNYQRSIGKKITFYNPILDVYTDKVEFVLANGVFLHFPPDELKIAFENLYKSLNPNGIIAFSIKVGNFEGYVYHHLIEPRYEKFWDLTALKELILNCNFNIIDIDNDDNWARVIIQKASIHATTNQPHQKI